MSDSALREAARTLVRPARAPEAHPSGAPAQAGRLAAIDALRLLAAVAVAAYHYVGTPTPASGASGTTCRRRHPCCTRSAATAGSASRRSS